MTDFQPLLAVLLCFAAYLTGSVLFAIPVCRLTGVPGPRSMGSGNPGATNVFRTGGWLPASLTLIFDAAKGWLPVWIAGELEFSILIQAMVALCAVAGHMVPAWFRFKGGKGVATALGAGLAIAPITTLLLTAIWALAMWRWRISALASIISVLAGPILSALIEPDSLPLFGLLAVLIVVRHRNNLIRMAQGREPGF